MDITVYLPDELGKWAKENDLGLSRMLREAVEDEKRRRGAVAKVTAGGFERIEVPDSDRERDVAFQGRVIGYTEYLEQTAYLTPKGAIAVYSADREKLWIYDGYHDFSEGHPEDLVAQVAAELGENYVEMLDI
jgi:hypothetical protein